MHLEWVKNILAKLGILVSPSIVLKSDNRGATFLTSNPACHTKLKQVMMDLQYAQERVEHESIIVQRVLGTKQ